MAQTNEAPEVTQAGDNTPAAAPQVTIAKPAKKKKTKADRGELRVVNGVKLYVKG
jgi:hypothetical protein